MKRLVFAAILGTALLFAAAPAMAQIGDLAGTTPCCDKVCTGSTSTKCGDLVAGGLSQMLSGCAGIDDQFPATCAGGQLLDAGDSALLDGCLCVLGTCVGPLAAGGAALTPEQCTAASVAACQETGNVVVTENDADCASCPPGQTSCAGTCVDTSTDPANCGSCGNACPQGATCEGGACIVVDCFPPNEMCGDQCVDTSSDEANCGACGNACAAGETCESGVCTPPPTCSGPEQPCPNGKGDCCEGLQCVDNSATDHRKVCRHGH